MNIKQTIIAMVLAVSCLTISAKAQKTYTEGSAIYSIASNMGEMEAKFLFKPDSNAYVTQQGPANIKLISNNNGTYAVILVDVSIASIKKAAVLTPADLEQLESKAPKYTFTATTETKQINGFNCKKVIAKDAKSGSSIDIWVTNDLTAPLNNVTKVFVGAGGYPVQFTATERGQTFDATLKSITQEKLPAGSFSIPAGFDSITLNELNALDGR
ncbi:hypothetical protein GCM10027049_16480 [Mucilaginibacter puniceus]